MGRARTVIWLSAAFALTLASAQSLAQRAVAPSSGAERATRLPSPNAQPVSPKGFMAPATPGQRSMKNDAKRPRGPGQALGGKEKATKLARCYAQSKKTCLGVAALATKGIVPNPISGGGTATTYDGTFKEAYDACLFKACGRAGN